MIGFLKNRKKTAAKKNPHYSLMYSRRYGFSQTLTFAAELVPAAFLYLHSKAFYTGYYKKRMKFSYLLFPFAILYGTGMRLRNFFYDSGIFSIFSFEYPVIGVGNLTVGGTGKTPHIEYLIRYLMPNFKVATLSRGYGRKSKGFLIVKPGMSVARAGDEPLQFKTKFPEIKVVVGEKRVPAMMSLLATYPDIEVVLLDDAYQHRSIKPGLSILLTEYKHLFTRDYLLPAGTLREPRRALRRAHIVIVTKTPAEATDDSFKRIRAELKIPSSKSLFFTTMKYNALVPVNGVIADMSPSNLRNQHVLAFSGLARPSGFVSFLKNNARSVTHIRYPDHYNYTPKDISKLREKFNEIESDDKIIITTEKDWMRIRNEPFRDLFDGLPAYTIGVQVEFVDRREKVLFESKITNYVEKNQPNRLFYRK